MASRRKRSSPCLLCEKETYRLLVCPWWGADVAKKRPSRLHGRHSPTPTLMPIIEERKERVRVPARAGQINDRRASAQHRSDAVEPALWGQDSLGQAMHVSGGEREKTLSDARRCTGVERSARQQKRAEAWVAYARSH
jgi:hypothetical protein